MNEKWFLCSLIFVSYLLFVNTPMSINPKGSFLYSLAFIRWPLFAMALSYWLLKSQINLLNEDSDIELIKIISNFPRIIEQSAIHMEPHRIAFYLRDLASSFHSYWNLGNQNSDFKVINTDDIETSKARVALIRCTGITISEGLRVLGIEALEELR